MNDDALVLMPTAGELLRAAAAINRRDGEAAQAELNRYLQSPFGSGVAIIATYDLAARLAAFVGTSLALGANHPDGSLVPMSDAPKHVRVAIAVGNAVTAGNAAEALALYLEEANVPAGPDDDGWAGAALVLALEALHSTLELTAADRQGGRRELRLPE